jgi:TPP-dependent pyruvate/acetoin dehydrogenase alpha subunit
VTIPRERMLPMLNTMLLMRRTEEAVIEIGDEFPGNFHVYIGQEGTGACVISQLRPEDPVYTTHRGHAHNVARGMPPEQVLAEILGRTTGPSGGKGGTFHVMSEHHHTNASAIVGGSTIMATGAALAAQVLKDNRIGVAFLGDRTLNEGAPYEAFNLASLWSLPVLYVCENNVAGSEGGPRASNLTVKEIIDVARTFNIETVAVDATDPVKLHDTVVRAVNTVRNERRPFFLETRTPRWPGNVGADPTLSVTGPTDLTIVWNPPKEDPQEAWHRADPVLNMTREVLVEEVADQQAIMKLDSEVLEVVSRAKEAARAAPFPPGDAAFADALAGGDLWPR